MDKELNNEISIEEVKDRTTSLIQKLLEIWQNSVESTHLFLSKQEINKIKKYVPQALKEIEHLIIAEEGKNNPIAFMGIENKKLEMLFIQNNKRGQGLGKRLLNYGINNYEVNELTVNEQNPKATEFYQHMGFKTYKRTQIDEQGNPYPILYMKLN